MVDLRRPFSFCFFCFVFLFCTNYSARQCSWPTRTCQHELETRRRNNLWTVALQFQSRKNLLISIAREDLCNRFACKTRRKSKKNSVAEKKFYKKRRKRSLKQTKARGLRNFGRSHSIKKFYRGCRVRLEIAHKQTSTRSFKCNC